MFLPNQKNWNEIFPRPKFSVAASTNRKPELSVIASTNRKPKSTIACSDLRRAVRSLSRRPISVAPSHLRRTLPSSSRHHRHAVAPSPSALSSSLHLSRVVSVSPFCHRAISFCGSLFRYLEVPYPYTFYVPG